MFIAQPFSRRFAGCLLAMALLAAAAFGADWSGPERELAQKILAATGPSAVSLDFANLSSLPKNDADSVQSSLRARLASLGLRFVQAEQAEAVIEVSLSENVQSYVWVARIRQGQSVPAVVMVPVPRDEPAAVVHEPAVMLLRKILLWSQDEPILDVGVVDSSPPHVVILEPGRIALYGLQGSRWQQEYAYTISHSRPWPRDLRGRVLLRKERLFDVYLPGVFCASSSGTPLSVACRESDDPWPIGAEQIALGAFFSPTRNFFTGALAPGVGSDKNVPAYYTAAALPRDRYVMWLFAGIDGRVREIDGMSTQTLVRANWGSDIASIRTQCSSGWQVLAAGAADGASLDAVRAFEFPDRDPVAASQSLEFGGPVTSLWTESGGGTAVAVSRNVKTGKYEAFRLAITCGQ